VFPILLASMLSLQTADLGTSCYAFAHVRHELNPLVPTSCVAASLETAALDAGTLYMLRRTPRMRFIAIAAVIAAESVAVSPNVRAMKQR